MSSLAANLRIYYQCRWMFAYYVIVAIISLPLILIPIFAPDRAEERGFFFAYLFVGYFVGYFVTVMQKESMVKPFTYCLPGHRTFARRIIFTAGLVTSVLLGLVFLRYPGLVAEHGWVGASLTVWSAACMSLVFYLLAAVLGWRVSSGVTFWGLPLLLTWPMFAGPAGQAAERVGTVAAPVTLIMVLVAGIVWFYLRPDQQARHLCGANYLAPHESLNRSKIDRFRRHAKIQPQRPPLFSGLLAALFLPYESGRSRTHTERYIRGECFTVLSRLLPSTISATVMYILVFILLIVGLGYRPLSLEEGWPASANLIFLVPCIVASAVIIPIFSPLLLPVGRRERKLIGIYVGVLGGLLAVVLAVLCHGVSHAIFSHFPMWTVSGRELFYQATDSHYIYLPLLILPSVYGTQLIFGRWSSIPQTLLLILLGCWMFFGAASLRPDGPWVVAPVLIVFWGCYFWLVSHYCRREDLLRS